LRQPNGSQTAISCRAGGIGDHRCWQSQYAIQGVFDSLLKTTVKFDRNELFDFLLFLSARVGYQAVQRLQIAEKLLAPVERLRPNRR